MAALLGQLIAAQRTGRGEGRIPIGYLARLNRAFDTATTGIAPRVPVHDHARARLGPLLPG
jgi:hypothetical protein